IQAQSLWLSGEREKKAQAIKDIAVVVMDTGVDCGHEDLVANIDRQNSRSFADNSPCVDAWFHGTHVAGIIGAQGNNHLGIAGVAQDVPMVDFKVFSRIKVDDREFLYSTTEIIIKAFAAVTDLPYKLVVVNASFGQSGPDEQDMWKKTIGLLKDKALVVAAGTNEYFDTSKRDDMPCTLSKQLPHLTCVVGFDEMGRALGSAFGDKVEIAAPGSRVMSTVPGNDYKSESGSSMAVPHVSGLAAQVAKLQYMSGNLPKPSELKHALLTGSSFNPWFLGKIDQPRQASAEGTLLALQRMNSGQAVEQLEPIVVTSVSDGGKDGNFAPAPNGWITILGEKLSDTEYQPQNFPLPRELGGIAVLLNGEPVPIGFVSPTQVNVLLPQNVWWLWSWQPNTLIVVRMKDGRMQLGSYAVLPEFTISSTRAVVRAVTRPDGSSVCDASPAKSGETLTFWMTGLGSISPSPIAGALNSGTEQVTAQVEVKIDGLAVEAAVSIDVTPGVYKATITMPDVGQKYSVSAEFKAGDVILSFPFNYMQ
ncbi:MAG: S8 family serine peptidase, partial [Patescibacteria group bacterium]